MNLSVSPPIRIVAVLGLLLALAAALFSYTQGRSSDAATAPTAPIAKASTTAVLPKAKPAVARTPAPAAKPAAATPVAAKPAPTPAPAAPASGLPAAIDAALAANRVVVVSLYVPGARVDELSTAEARAGAELSGAGFVALNVLDEASSQPLLLKLGMLEDPSVLVFARPGTIVARIAGFSDRETVAQAAASAAP